jgi:hypothetical protein
MILSLFSGQLEHFLWIPPLTAHLDTVVSFSLYTYVSMEERAFFIDGFM